MPETKKEKKKPLAPRKKKAASSKIRVRKKSPAKSVVKADIPATTFAPEMENLAQPIVSAEISPVKSVELKSKISSPKLEINSSLPVKEEPIKKMPTPKINLYRKIAISFIVLTLLLLGVIFYFSFAKLNITLIPTQERVNDTVTFDIYGASSESGQAKTLPGIVEQIEISETNTYTASGLDVIGEEVAGKVTIVNDYTKNQPLVATTRLLSADNKLYRIKNTVNVPAGGSAEVEVYADEPKPEMAIGPSKFTIPGLWAGLQEKIYGESKEKFVYGQQGKRFIQQTDLDEAIKDLKRSLLSKAQKELGDNYKGYNKILFTVDENSVSTEVDGKVGEEKDKFKVSMKTLVTIVAFSKEEVSEVAQKKLLESISENRELVEFNPEEIVYTLGDYDTKQSWAKVETSFTGKMTLKSDAEIIDRKKLVNLTKDQLEDYLKSFKEISGYRINFSPSFVEKAPSLVDRINIEIKR